MSSLQLLALGGVGEVFLIVAKEILAEAILVVALEILAEEAILVVAEEILVAETGLMAERF